MTRITPPKLITALTLALTFALAAPAEAAYRPFCATQTAMIRSGEHLDRVHSKAPKAAKIGTFFYKLIGTAVVATAGYIGHLAEFAALPITLPIHATMGGECKVMDELDAASKNRS